jgi:CHAT domain-containing protein
VELRGGRLPAAFRDLRKAEAGYSAAGESAYAGYLESLIARTLRQMGWRREGWAARGRALEVLTQLDPERRYNVLEEVVETLDEEERFHAAPAFLEAQLATAREAARQRGTSDLPVFAALNTWEMAWTAGDTGRARQAIEQADLLLREVAPGSENRERLDREVALARAWTQGADGHELLLERLFRFYERHGDGEQLDALRLLQLRVASDLTRQQGVNLRPHLQAAMRRAAAIGHWVVEPVQRRALQRRQRWLLARLIELESATDARRALLAALRARNPAAFPSQGLQQGLPPLAGALPPGAALLVHFAVQGATFGWLIEGARLQSWRAPVGAFELGQLATSLRGAAASADAETFQRTAKRLGQVLLPPSGWGHAGVELFVLTDEATSAIAFSALVDPATGRPLLDDHAVAVRSQMGRVSAGWLDPVVSRPTSLALIAAPDLDPRAFPGLAPLTFAREEGEAISRMYPRTEKSIGRSVSWSVVKAAFRSASVVHLAVHARGPREAGEPGLVLGLGPDGVLGGAEVQRLGLRAAVVVLAACRSAASDDDDPGSSSIAQAFLDSGSGSVVASLWPVDDRQSSMLFVRLHQELVQGKDPAQALRTAQLALRTRLGVASYLTWPAFQVFAGTERSNRDSNMMAKGGPR